MIVVSEDGKRTPQFRLPNGVHPMGLLAWTLFREDVDEAIEPKKVGEKATTDAEDTATSKCISS